MKIAEDVPRLSPASASSSINKIGRRVNHFFQKERELEPSDVLFTIDIQSDGMLA